MYIHFHHFWYFISMVISELAPNNRPSFLTVYSSNKKLEHNQCLFIAWPYCIHYLQSSSAKSIFFLSVPDVTKSGRAAWPSAAASEARGHEQQLLPSGRGRFPGPRLQRPWRPLSSLRFSASTASGAASPPPVRAGYQCWRLRTGRLRQVCGRDVGLLQRGVSPGGGRRKGRRRGRWNDDQQRRLQQLLAVLYGAGRSGRGHRFRPAGKVGEEGIEPGILS